METMPRTPRSHSESVGTKGWPGLGLGLIVTLSALLLPLVLGCGCGHLYEVQRADRLRAEARSSVQVETDQSMGSGVFISKRDVLTAGHVVKDGSEFSVTTDDGSACKALLVHLDEDADLAILEVEDGCDPGHGVAELASEAPRPGDEVESVSNPYGWRPEKGSFMVRGIFVSDDRELGKNFFDLGMAGGSSGAPVFSDGKLVSLSNFCIPNRRNRTPGAVFELIGGGPDLELIRDFLGRRGLLLSP